MQQQRHNNISANTKGSTYKHKNISATYTRHITSLPITRFNYIKEPTILHNNISAIYKKKKKKNLYAQ